ncbi:hypothetical protein FJY70_02555, partial [candidate division WOR-3 bacterium]|nr:hypothetical protein [candidate division WOR-3 bacterium]
MGRGASPLRVGVQRKPRNLNRTAPRPSLDTICALATPHGKGSIAVVRVSGARTLGILDRLFPSSPPSRQRSHTLRLRWLVKPGSEDSRRGAPINAEGHRSSLPASICGS